LFSLSFGCFVLINFDTVWSLDSRNSWQLSNKVKISKFQHFTWLWGSYVIAWPGSSQLALFWSNVN
jgi:hypothetical protein